MTPSSRLVRVLLPAAAVVVLAACGSSTASTTSGTAATSASTGKTAPVRCGPAGARTLVSGSRARVYSLAGTVSACLAGSEKTLRLGSSGSCLRSSRAGPVAVSGTLVALASERCGVDMGSTVVVVRRLPGGQTLFAHVALPSPGPESFTSVGSIVLSSQGRVAWIAHGGSIVANHSESEVVAQSRQGVHVLDKGAAIVLGSLGLRDGRLRWRDGSSQHSAPLA